MIKIVLLSALSAAFFWIYHVRYFKWRSCFNEQGRCYDGETGDVYIEGAGWIWMSLALLTLSAALYHVWRRWRRVRRASRLPGTR